ncbi:MAG: PEP/pyruvate-binding domain-containing protein [Anaerolineae bacterium]
MSKEYLVPLARAKEEERFGGKAANLARLLSAGLETAPGQVLGVEVMEQHLVRLRIVERVASFFSAFEDGDTEDLHAEAEWLRQTLLDSHLHTDLIRDIEMQLQDGVVYAVRSSAPGEDGSMASFAGQFDSFLGCRSVESVAEAVCGVWASLFSQRAVSYAIHRRSAQRGMAVVIQQQIDAAVSGVMFTRDPRNPADYDLLVEYCTGLGEQLVAGQVSPGRLRINRDEGTVKEEAFPDVPITWQPSLPEVASVLREVALKLESLFGVPQDVEWSLDKAGHLFLLQSRPVTGTAEQSAVVYWTNANIAENFPDPVVPMLRSFVGRGYAAYFRGLGQTFGISKQRLRSMDNALDNLIGVHGGRLYYNLSNIHTVIYLAPGGPWLARFFNQFTGAQEFPEPERIQQGWAAQLWEILGVALKVVWRYLHVQRGLRRFERRVDAYAADSAPARLRLKSPEQLARLLQRFLEIRLERWTDAALADTAAMVCYGVLQGLLDGRTDVDANDLLKGLPGLASAQPVERLWDLSRELRRDAGLAEVFINESAENILTRLREGEFPTFLDSLNTYFDTWGFRSSGELMLAQPTPAENPLPVLRLLKSYVTVESEGPAEISRRQAQARLDATRKVRGQLGLLRGIVFALVLRATQGAIRLRERARMKQSLLYTRLRHVALALGDRLVSQGLLGKPDDILYLAIQEAISLGEGGHINGSDILQRVSEERSGLSACMALNPPDSFTLPKGEVWQAGMATIEDEIDTSGEGLVGTGACGGHASGHAAVVLDVAEIDRICKDQILITRQTDPGWAAVFFMIKGLVIERGGLLSHGAIIAREYGIPAVVGVRDATRLIKDGQVVHVDGNRGQVGFVRD